MASKGTDTHGASPGVGVPAAGSQDPTAPGASSQELTPGLAAASQDATVMVADTPTSSSSPEYRKVCE